MPTAIAASIKAVAFDKDGTLLRYDSFWLPAARPAIAALLQSRGLADGPVEEMLLAVGADRGTDGLLCHGSYAQIGLALSDPLRRLYPALVPFSGEETAAAFGAAARSGRLEPTYPHIQALFAALRRRGLAIAVITTDTADMTRWCLEGLGIADAVDFIYGDDGAGPTKPDPYYMTCFCRDAGCRPEEILMVGDTVTDLQFARNSGTHFLLVGSDSALAAQAPFARPHIGAVPEVLALLAGDAP